jgi:hypothetical protein
VGYFVYNLKMQNINTTIMQLVFSFCIIIICLLAPAVVYATPEYARQTGQECKLCHIDTIGGGPLSENGKRFLDDLKSRVSNARTSVTRVL